jgi:hypothetical protein
MFFTRFIPITQFRRILIRTHFSVLLWNLWTKFGWYGPWVNQSKFRLSRIYCSVCRIWLTAFARNTEVEFYGYFRNQQNETGRNLGVFWYEHILVFFSETSEPNLAGMVLGLYISIVHPSPLRLLRHQFKMATVTKNRL